MAREERKGRRNKRNKAKNKITFLISISVVLLVLIFSVYKIVVWVKDNNEIREQTELINEKVEISEVKDENKDIEIIEQDKKPEPTNPYWDYIKMNLIDVDFDNLKEINKYTAGWIQVNGTNVNYPYVQAYTNEHFLYNDFYNKPNEAGWIFMDYRNNKEVFDKNTIIYGHSRKDTTMFGSLKKILTSDWYNNKDNYIVKLSTDKENMLWQVFSIYHIKTTSDYLKTNFKSDNEYKIFLDMISKRSMKDFNTTVSTKDKVLTLSTCYKTDERLVLHAKLIKKSKK